MTRALARRAWLIRKAVPSVLPEPVRPSTSVWPTVRSPGLPRWWKLKQYASRECVGRMPNTVRNHVAALFRKINVNRRGAAIVWTWDRGFGNKAPPKRSKRRRL